jgi:hypothetical protein
MRAVNLLRMTLLASAAVIGGFFPSLIVLGFGLMAMFALTFARPAILHRVIQAAVVIEVAYLGMRGPWL